MYLSYSGFKSFKGCRRAYYYRYIAKPILTKPPNRVHTLYGDVVGKIFEKFYDNQIWTRSAMTPVLLDMVGPILNQVMIQETKKGGVYDWKERGLKPDTRSLAIVEEEIRRAIPRGIRSIKHHSLAGTEAKAEIILDGVVEGHKIGGRADFIIRRVRPHSDLVIIDGKGSRWRGKYTDVRQLRWYAMLYQLKEKVIPDRLGFLYWRYEPEESMDWSVPTQSELDDLRGVVLEAIGEIGVARKEIRAGANPKAVFLAVPGSDCRLCDYKLLCSEGSKVLSDDTKSRISEDRKRGVEEGEVSF